MTQQLTRLSLFTVAMLVLTGALTGCASQSSAQSEEQAARLKSDRELAEVALVGGRPESAIEIYRQQLENRPDDVELLYLLGVAYNQTGEFELALHFLNKAKVQDQAAEQQVRGDILRELGRAKLAMGDIRQAQLDLESAAKQLPQSAETMNSLGVSYALQQEYSKAREAFIAALAVEPGSLEYRNNLALGWILADHPQKGIDILYPNYLRGNSTTKTRQNLALAFAMKGDIEAAKTIAKQDLTHAELEKNLAYYQQWEQML
ncbi:lipopolysaccharide assembly protein LapB [Photobacterium sp. OFAV2-7]|uniref:tetratricopeptide repeat protein n=1 Tax=Photobacterium sp. OFAV2-7 TaxID=2917748 RepID=UPI001EF3D9A2|nr:tetratricopeptide repeat protein [Photobacterium sp. OFAV2-7]MCG7586841.1 tetratricopeptide repeat protein [Photobacterium sp. OFAV2-7]